MIDAPQPTASPSQSPPTARSGGATVGLVGQALVLATWVLGPVSFIADSPLAVVLVFALCAGFICAGLGWFLGRGAYGPLGLAIGALHLVLVAVGVVGTLIILNTKGYFSGLAALVSLLVALGLGLSLLSLLVAMASHRYAQVRAFASRPPAHGSLLSHRLAALAHGLAALLGFLALTPVLLERELSSPLAIAAGIAQILGALAVLIAFSHRRR
jgi:hypothetical protein